MLSTIVVPTDGSDHARKAVALAADLAEKYAARVVLLHVLLHGEPAIEFSHMAEVEHLLETEGVGATGRPTAGHWGDLSPSVARVAPSAGVLQKIADQVLGAAERSLHARGLKDVTTRTASGDPAKQIIACAEAEGADLIVIGTRGLGTLQGLLLGSVSQKVSHLASCSCLTVR